MNGMNPKITRDASGPVEAEDTIRDALDNLKRLASETRAEADRFSSDLSDAITNALNLGESLRAAHFDVLDEQQKRLGDVERGASAAEQYAAASSGGQVKIDRVAIVRDAARRTGAEAVGMMSPNVLGGTRLTDKGTLEPWGLAYDAAAAGQELEKRIARCEIRWKAGVGRPEQLDDLVAAERMRSTLRTKTAQDLFNFTAAMLGDPDLDDRTWATVDSIARDLACDAIKSLPTADRTRSRSDVALTARTYAQKTIALLDAEVERRTPRSVALAKEALESFRRVFKVLCGVNSTFMDQTEYRRFRDGGAAALAANDSRSWAVEPRWIERFIQPREFRMPGWSPIAFVDRQTGGRVRKPR